MPHTNLNLPSSWPFPSHVKKPDALWEVKADTLSAAAIGTSSESGQPQKKRGKKKCELPEPRFENLSDIEEALW